MKVRKNHNPSDYHFAEGSFEGCTKSERYKAIVNNIFIIIAIMITTTLVSFLFKFMGFHESNLIMVYILGVLLVAKQTTGYTYGILTCIIAVLTFNFFFAEPYYTLYTNRPDYPVTFSIMLIVAVITSALTSKVKHTAQLSALRETRAELLYQVSKDLLKTRSIEQIKEVGTKNLAKLFNSNVIIAIVESPDTLGNLYTYDPSTGGSTDLFDSADEKQTLLKAFLTGSPVEGTTDTVYDSLAYYLPIKGQTGTIGVLGIASSTGKLFLDEQKTLLDTVTAQIALAIEREHLWKKQQKSIMDVEKERLRGNLLGAMSHDLRTPLTGILGATTTIIDNYEILDKEVIKNLLLGVYEDTSWLIHSVENILSITRMDEQGIVIKKNMEALEEIIAEAVSRVKKLSENHVIKINIPDHLILLPMDGTLIKQVLVNIIDNAIKYTPDDATIEVKVEFDGEQASFTISDNGNGIPDQDIPFIFDRFYTSASNDITGRRGTGLGLAICKSIIEAHGGKITAFNNVSGGATFRFILPAKDES